MEHSTNALLVQVQIINNNWTDALTRSSQLSTELGELKRDFLEREEKIKALEKEIAELKNPPTKRTAKKG